MKIQLHFLAVLAAASLSFQALADGAAVDAAAAQVAAPAQAAPSAPTNASTSRNMAVILHPVALRDRPVARSTGDVIATANKPVRLERGVKNADGDWWYVTATGLGGGWVLASDMGNLPQ